MKKKILFLFAYILFLSQLTAQEAEPELSWPKEIETKEGVITLYQPQLDSYSNIELEARMAVSINPPEKNIIFGAVWLSARVSTDKENRTVTLEKMDIIKVHFPDLEDQTKVDQFGELLVEEIESWNLEMSLDRVIASMDEVENLQTISDKLNNDPPEIYFRTSATVLISIDGDPKTKTDENSKLDYVANTPYFIVQETKKKDYYLKGGSFWYTSKDILSGWEETKKVPSKIEKFAEDNIEEGEPDSVDLTITEAPELIVVTKPSELIISDGDPEYATIEGTTLLYAANSESDIIMDINSQNHYVLLGGRWFYSKTLKDGDWTFAEPKDLPVDFSKIPQNSEMEDVRASIPGTPESQDALLEQSIPQTATVDRKEAKVEVTYDGEPKFEKIEGTEVSYALNTDKQVLLISGNYYCLDNAVWFVSGKPTGPWEVSDTRPNEVDQIPPESPVYNVKYVYIYDSTPEVVYVGYLPGYTYSYVYGGTVVYGTGYYYTPWYGAYYYPRPVTWGYGVHWNPYTGWGFHIGFGYGWMGWGFHPYRRGLWGPRGYRHGYRHGYRRGYRRGRNAGFRAGYRAGQRNSSRNVYNNRSNGVRQSGNMGKAQAGKNMNSKARPSSKPNNMYSDRNGNVSQRNQNGSWEQKSNRGQSTQTRPSTSQSQQLNKSAQNRSRGTQNYNNSRSSSASRGGASRGGGGGRRR